MSSGLQTLLTAANGNRQQGQQLLLNRKETPGTLSGREVISEEPRGNIIALALLLAFLWGGNSLAIKIGLQDFPPMALAFLRFVIGLIVIGGWALYRPYSTSAASR